MYSLELHTLEGIHAIRGIICVILVLFIKGICINWLNADKHIKCNLFSYEILMESAP